MYNAQCWCLGVAEVAESIHTLRPHSCGSWLLCTVTLLYRQVLLYCFATFDSLSASNEMTRPVLVETSSSPVLEIRNGWHPCIVHTYAGGDYIPNDVIIEGEQSCVLVTGPNMGGKSTLLRQTGLLVVLAQLVCVCVRACVCVCVCVCACVCTLCKGLTAPFKTCLLRPHLWAKKEWPL